MRVQLTLTLGLIAASCLMAGAEAETTLSREATILGGPRTRVSMYIWSDKYVYQEGQKLTLRWTLKTNGDRYPYTIFAYRQNNQNGKKFYLPSGQEAATDVNGRSEENGFDTAPLSDASKAILIGDGGRFPRLSRFRTNSACTPSSCSCATTPAPASSRPPT